MYSKMSSADDWMARSHEGLFDQANQTADYLTGDVLMRIGITGPILEWYNTEFLPGQVRYNAVFANWRNPAERTPAKQAALEDEEKKFRKVYRQFYNGYMKGNPLVTNEDLVSAGLPRRHEGGNVPVKVPTTLVVVTVDTSKPGRVGFHFRDEQMGGNAKPEGVHGGELVSAILDTPPTDWSQLIHSVFFTRTPGELVFTGEQRSRTLYYAMRWENTRGQKGPWCQIQSVIIP
jgi:hypothetical protein